MWDKRTALLDTLLYNGLFHPKFPKKVNDFLPDYDSKPVAVETPEKMEEKVKLMAQVFSNQRRK